MDASVCGVWGDCMKLCLLVSWCWEGGLYDAVFTRIMVLVGGGLYDAMFTRIVVFGGIV